MQTQESPRRRQKYDKVELPGCIDELIRVPTSSLYKTNSTRNDYADFDTFGNPTPLDRHMITSTNMSVYASAIDAADEYGSFRKSVLPKERQLGIAEAKRKMIKNEFHLGQEHDGNLDDMVIRGENILRKEI